MSIYILQVNLNPRVPADNPRTGRAQERGGGVNKGASLWMKHSYCNEIRLWPCCRAQKKEKKKKKRSHSPQNKRAFIRPAACATWHWRTGAWLSHVRRFTTSTPRSHAFSQAQTEKPAEDLMGGCGDDQQHMTLRAATSQLLSFFSLFFFLEPIICQKSALCHLRLIRQAGRYVKKHSLAIYTGENRWVFICKKRALWQFSGDWWRT